MEVEIKDKIDLLNKEGHIIKEGWARFPYWKYSRKAIKANSLRIKEWDYYAITNHEKEYTIAITVSDLGYISLQAITFIDLKLKKSVQSDITKLLPLGKLKLPANSDEEHYYSFSSEKLRISIIVKDDTIHLLFSDPTMQLPDGNIGLDVDIVLTKQQNAQSINIATSWAKNRKAFYLNEKKNCLLTKGSIKRGNTIDHVTPLTTLAVLDWGRGNWTYKNTWYWSSLSAVIENKLFGFNLGYGFSDRTPASENCIYYDGIIHKIENVHFKIPSDYISEPWIIESTKNKINLTFTPLVDRQSKFNLGIIKSDQHQVFGKFSGTAVLDNSEIINLNNIIGFAEKVANRW